MTLLHPPTDHEVALSGKALMNSLDSIDGEISCLQDRLNTLSLEQRQLRTSLESYKGLLSPIRRLLPEILQEVFRHCLPTAHNTLMGAEEMPLVLGRVCSRWRGIAYSTPELWASIHIVAIIPPHSTSPQARRAIALRHAVAAWLSRSGTLPLSISLVNSNLDFYQQRNSMTIVNDEIRPYLDLIAPYAHRWQSIYFTMIRFRWIEFFNRFRASDVPLLESLHANGERCDHHNQQDIIPAISTPTSILQAPQLRVLSIPSYSIRALKSGAQLQNLTGLNITDFCSSPSQDIIQILGLCPNLRKCTIQTSPGLWGGGGYVPFSAGSVTTMTMPKLQSLVVSDTVQPRYVDRLLRILVTPSLRHLLIPLSPQDDAPEPDHLYDSLSSFLQHLIDPLEELDLSYSVQGDNPASILSLVPELKRLSLHPYFTLSQLGQLSHWARNRALAQLTPNSNWRRTLDSEPSDEPSYYDTPTCFCPKLEVLHYVNVEFPDNELLDFLHSRTTDHRKNNVSHIRMVSVHFCRREQDNVEEMDLNLRKGIEALERETGVRVDCRYSALSPADGFGGSATIKYSSFDGISPMAASNLDPVTGTDDYFGF